MLDGFLKEDGTTRGRPTWVEWAQDGALLVSDDTAGIIWRTSAPDAQPGAGITPIAARTLPPVKELIDPRAKLEEAYLRRMAEEE